MIEPTAGILIFILAGLIQTKNLQGNKLIKGKKPEFTLEMLLDCVFHRFTYLDQTITVAVHNAFKVKDLNETFIIFLNKIS